MKRLAVILLCVPGFLLGGCASRLSFFSVADKPGEIRGVRVFQRVPYVLTKKVESQKCPAKQEESIIHLAVGDPYDINVEHSAFAKGEFTVILNDEGALKQVTLNSTPQVAEIAKSAGDLIEKLANVGKASAAAAPDCGAVISETIVNVRRLQVPR